MKDKKVKKDISNKTFIIFVIIAVFLLLLGTGAIIFAFKYHNMLKNKEYSVQTEVIYKKIPEGAKPIEKDTVTEKTNYETPVDAPPLKLLDVPYINQRAKYPTGCESVSAVMALNYAGYSIKPEEFIDNYLPKSPAPYIENGKCLGYNPSKAFLGDPYSNEGWGCYYPVIWRCLNRIIDHESHEIVNLHKQSIKDLLAYVDNGTPVIIWATQGMNKPRRSQTWTIISKGVTFTWVSPNHCLLLVGYDDTGYYFNDPLTHKNCRYPADIVEKRYKSMGRQALAIVKKD